ncbi:MAG: cytochrome P450 [Halioglobus sp.]|nr:cytochrome P450 [Halioglobus sp.]
MRAPFYSDCNAEIFFGEVIESPQALNERLRECAPLARVGRSGFHLVSSWDLIDEVLQREEDFSANLTGVLYEESAGKPGVFELPGAPEGAASVIATADEPRHAVHRALIQPRFTGKVSGMEVLVRQWAREVLTPLFEQGGGDIIPASEQLPARVVAHLLGLPEGDLDHFRRWSMLGGDLLAGQITGDRLHHLAGETKEMQDYLARFLDVALANPRSGSEEPLMHLLALGMSEGEISREEALGIATVLFGAGGESTAALIGSCFKWLSEDRSLAEKLRQQPSDIPRFVEEVVRLEPPFKFHYRVVRRGCELGGYALCEGDRLMLSWAAVNRDPDRFERPDELRLDRKHSKLHMGFGRGPHFCIGAVLARLEGKVMVEELLSATRRIAPSPDVSPVYTKSIFVRRLERLHLDLR